ncbi:hypothetical protein KPL70_025932 [Citrus sinensis]|nr:hypothetical protein KPL70_025932 [Citrus sinensis]
MTTSLPPEALTKKIFPLDKTFSSVFVIQEFARKAVFRFFMKAYLLADSFPFSAFHLENLFLTGLTLAPSSEITEDELWSRETFLFMASTSSTPPSNPVTLSSTLSLPKSCTSHTANKIENLVEYSYIPESAQIKYIQSSRLDQCALQATSAKQYVTLEIPSELISNWKREGYTHLHLGGIRLILTLHGRKGLPVTVRIAMLDTQFKQYQDAVIGTVLTTLHVGSVLLTFYPNFNISLQDTNLPTTLKVQIQIQDPSSTPDDQTSAQTSDSNLAIPNSHSESDTESSVSTSDSEKSYADITRIPMAQPDQPDHAQTSHTEPYVDIPLEVDKDIPEFSATHQPLPAQGPTGPTSQKSSNGATTQSVLREFATRFTGALRDWFDSLGQYRQLQFVQLPEVSSALAVIYDQFLGDPSAVFEAARRDYLNMKYCSLNAKDLDFHYKRMSLLFYKLNGFNEPTLKHVFLASLHEELQPDIQRQLTASNSSLTTSLLAKSSRLPKHALTNFASRNNFSKTC